MPLLLSRTTDWVNLSGSAEISRATPVNACTPRSKSGALLTCGLFTRGLFEGQAAIVARLLGPCDGFYDPRRATTSGTGHDIHGNAQPLHACQTALREPLA